MITLHALEKNPCNPCLKLYRLDGPEEVRLPEPHLIAVGVLDVVLILGVLVPYGLMGGGVQLAGHVAAAVSLVPEVCLLALGSIHLAAHLVYAHGYHPALIVAVHAEAVVCLVAKVGGARDVLHRDAALAAVQLHLHLAGVCHQEDEQLVLHGKVAERAHHVAVPGVLAHVGAVLLLDEVEGVYHQQLDAHLAHQ